LRQRTVAFFLATEKEKNESNAAASRLEPSYLRVDLRQRHGGSDSGRNSEGDEGDQSPRGAKPQRAHAASTRLANLEKSRETTNRLFFFCLGRGFLARLLSQACGRAICTDDAKEKIGKYAENAREARA
jgi:hypothetical protein